MIRAGLSLAVTFSTVFWIFLILHPIETLVAYAALLIGIAGAAWLIRERVVVPMAIARWRRG